MHDLRKPVSESDQGFRREKLTRSAYFIGAVLFHLILFLLLATWVIFQAPTPPPTEKFTAVKINVAPPPPPPPPSESGGGSPNAPTDPVPPTPPPPQALAMVHTQNSSTFMVSSAKLMNEAISHTTGAAPQGGLGHGTGPGTGPGSGLFGSNTSSGGLIGTLYDLKQTPDHKPTPMAESGDELSDPNGAKGGWENYPSTLAGVKVIHDFIRTWNTDDLAGYFHTASTLSASQIFIPRIQSLQAPKAFNADGIVHPRRWIVVYKGTFMPPRDGTFRFIGSGDDFLIANVDGTNVLDASYPAERVDPKANMQVDVGNGPDYLRQPLVCGQWFKTHRGDPVTFQILIGEGPGGDSAMCLMIDDLDHPSPKGDYPVFQVQDVPIPQADNPSDIPPGFTGRKFLFAPKD